MSDARLADYVDALATSEDLSAAVLVVRDGRVVVDRGYGRADDGSGTAFTPDTVVGLASLSKQVAAAAVMRLVDTGRLALDDDLGGLLGGTWVVPMDKQEITVGELLTHSSGLGDHVIDSDLEPLGRDAAVERILAQDLAFAPGTGTQYSNAGYTMVAAIVEVIAGRTYADVIDDELFAPVGVSGIAPWGDARFTGKPVSTGYFNGSSSGPVDRLPGPYWTVTGNGDLLATTRDLLGWFDALHGGRVLSPASTAAVFTAHPLRDGTPTESGYGWEVSRDPVVGATITHNGGGITGNTVLARYPDLGLTVIVLGNRITYRTVADVPLLIRLPADETAAAIAAAAATGDTEEGTTTTWDATPYLVIASLVLILVLTAAIWLIRRTVRRRQPHG